MPRRSGLLARQVFEQYGLSLVDYRELLSAAEWRRFDVSSRLTTEGTYNPFVMIVGSGTAEVFLQ